MKALSNLKSNSNLKKTESSTSPSGSPHEKESLLEQWAPAVRLLLECNLLVVVTGYSDPPLCSESVNAVTAGSSSATEWTHDALVDEHVLSDYFSANIVVPRTYNPIFHRQNSIANECEGKANGSDARNKVDSYYLAFRGRRHAAVSNQIEFLRFMAQSNAGMRSTCFHMTEEIGAGRLVFPIQLTHHQLEQEAHHYDRTVFQQRMQQLQCGKIAGVTVVAEGSTSPIESATMKTQQVDLKAIADTKVAATDGAAAGSVTAPQPPRVFTRK